MTDTEGKKRDGDGVGGHRERRTSDRLCESDRGGKSGLLGH